MDLAERLKQIGKEEDKYKESREFDKGVESYTEWLKSVPVEMDQDLRTNVALAYNNRGQLKYLAVDFDGALDDYNMALTLNPLLACSYYNRGTVHYRMGYFDKAIVDLQKAVELEPNVDEFRIGLQKCRDVLENKTS